MTIDSTVPIPLLTDSQQPFVEVETPVVPPTIERREEFVLEIPVPGASIDDLALEVVAPLLILHRGGSHPETRSFAMLAHVDTDSIRARLDDGVLRVTARRRWTRPRRLLILSDFLLGGHVGMHDWERQFDAVRFAGDRC